MSNISLLVFFQPAETKKTFECNICLQKFTRRTKLNNHLEAVHQQEQEQHHQWRFQCPCCENKLFRTLTQLIGHCDEHHDIEFGIEEHFTLHKTR